MAHTDWLTEGRFGLFIHFGAYSTAARHEWVRNYERLSVKDYQPYVDHFDPDLFDARALVRAAVDAGMTYAVLTAKHHDGFCLWNSATTDYSVHTNTGRDLVTEFVAAAREAGLRVGLYFSLIDWYHPDFAIDWNHPLRDEPNVAELNADRSPERYRDYLHAQVGELLTNYGTIDYLFFDFTYPETKAGLAGKSAADWDAPALLALCRELQPGILVNDRTGLPGDFVTPEQYQPTQPLERDGEALVWEACQTTNGSWGYHRDNDDHKSPDLLVRMLADSVSMGGNLLLNVGPNGRGELDPRDGRILAAIGEWMRLHSAAIHGAGHTALTPPREGVYTRRGNRLYLHVWTWPMGALHLPGLAGRATYVRFLHDGSWIRSSVSDPGQIAGLMQPAGQSAGTLTLHLPTRRPDVLVPVIEITLAEEDALQDEATAAE